MATKEQKAEDGREEALDAEHSDARVYELSFHIDPDVADTDAKKAYQALRDIATTVGALVAEGEPQKIQLAYTVSRTEQSVRRDFDSSWFSWFAYETDSLGHAEVLTAAKGESRIFRFLDIRTSKEVVEHAAEMQDLLMKSPEKKEEEVSDAELDTALKEAGV